MIRITQIPNLLRALGCYLSSQEEADILAYLKSRKGRSGTEFDVRFTHSKRSNFQAIDNVVKKS
ncbi:MAG: hypothetical protein AAF329_21890, partial [Cyanobacteria bacterium P01_A01_bin.17]